MGEGTEELVLLHGFGASSFSWRHWVAPLGREFRLRLVDLKGFGRSAKPRGPGYSPLDQAEHLVRLLRELDTRNVILVGHSLGGGIALQVALRFRETPGERDRIRALCIIAGAAYRQPIPKYIAMTRMPILPPLAMRLLPPSVLMRKALRDIVHPDHPVDDAQVAGYAAPLRRWEGRRALLAAAKEILPIDTDTVTARYPTLDLPTLLLWGREDPVVPLAYGQRLAADLPSARLAVLDRCGHVPQEEIPERSLPVLLEFLRSLEEGSPGRTAG